MSKEQFESEKRHVEGNKSISNFIFVCPQCGKELMPSSICKDCFPNGSYIETTAEQESFIDSEMYKIDSDIETQSVQALDKEEKNTAEDSESDHFTWQDFLYLVNVLRLFYKKYTKKVWLVSSVVVLAITAFATYQHFTPKGKLILFAEKKNLVYSYTKKPSEKYVIEKNWNSELKGGFSMYNYYSFARASQDEKYIFYRKQKVVSTVADNVTRETDEEFGTYYRYDVEGKKKIKIDDQVRNSFTASSTNISPSGSKAMYLKGTDNKLVIWNNGKKITIDEMVSFYFVNKQATHVFYGKQGGNYENQGKIYEWSEKTGKKTVSENAVLQGFQMDQNGEISIYFKKDQSIYFKNGDNATKLVSTKADSILSCSGEKIYYTVSSALPFILLVEENTLKSFNET
ncbi:MAG: hypothetical protein K0R71_789 [Bacillales bacterium]|nr:hypothetical protein [Bacillales bacterium]